MMQYMIMNIFHFVELKEVDTLIFSNGLAFLLGVEEQFHFPRGA